MTGRPTRTSTERIATPRSARLANGRSSVRRYGGLVAVGARVEKIFKAMGGCRLRQSSLRERPAIKESTRVSMAQWRPERTRQDLSGNHGDPRRAQLFQIANLYADIEFQFNGSEYINIGYMQYQQQLNYLAFDIFQKN